MNRGRVSLGRTQGRCGIDQSFCRRFLSQPFHLDEEGGRASLFKGLAASGWHTAAMTQRLVLDSGLDPAGGVISAGFDELRWPRPVRPGDELSFEGEVLEVRRSGTRPGSGVIKVKGTTFNQNREPCSCLLAI
ncbi:MAG: MaoC/PaaZ C-terminal domain-containing protein [Hyphomonadaceae bacterium]